MNPVDNSFGIEHGVWFWFKRTVRHWSLAPVLPHSAQGFLVRLDLAATHIYKSSIEPAWGHRKTPGCRQVEPWVMVGGEGAARVSAAKALGFAPNLPPVFSPDTFFQANTYVAETPTPGAVWGTHENPTTTNQTNYYGPRR